MPGLRAGTVEPETAGDIFWLGKHLQGYSSRQLVVLFGFGFDRAVKLAAPGEWTGPLKSGRGWHLVRVTETRPPKPLTGDELKRRLYQDWMHQYRMSRREGILAEMRKRYEIDLPRVSEIDG